MTDEQAKALGQRAVKCERWRWCDGMLDGRTGERIDHHCEATQRPVLFELRERWEDDHSSRWGPSLMSQRAWPDFRDPATLGCLLALVREVRGRPFAVPSVSTDEEGIEPPRWQIRAPLVYGSELLGSGATEAEALISTLEAAP